MGKENIIDVSLSVTPDVRVRVIDSDEPKEIQKQKKKFPFELHNSVDVKVTTTKREFTFSIYKGYSWNGADIPRFFWRLIGSRTDNDFLIASMLHDYMLEMKGFVMLQVLKNELSVKEYRRLTSLIFRHVIKEQGTGTIKANVMSFAVDIFQMINFKSWRV